MPFAMHVEYEKSDFLAFARAHNRVKNKVNRILQIVLTVLCGLLAVAMLLFWRSFGYLSTQMIVLLVLMPILATEMLWLPRILVLSMVKTYRKIGSIDISFDENEVRLQRSVESTVYQYGAFDSLYHGQEAFYLYLNRQQALVIPERCFIQGDPDDFGRFMAEKTGLPLKEIK